MNFQRILGPARTASGEQIFPPGKNNYEKPIDPRSPGRPMTLFFIHCGFYDEEISDGIYEFHVNIPIVAVNLAEAKAKVRLDPAFLRKKMHIDGIQEIKNIYGYELHLKETGAATHEIKNIPYRDL